MLIHMKDQQLKNYTIYYILGIIPFGMKVIKKKNLVIKEKKLELHLKKLIKKYQTSQLHMKIILMLCILVEHLHLAIYYQNLLIHPLLLHMLMMKKVIKVFSILGFLFFKNCFTINKFC